MSPIVIAGIGAPVAIVVVAAVIALVFDFAWGFALLALGLGAIIGVHLFHIHRVARWSDSSLDTPVPEAKGVWGELYSALYRRTRARNERQRDLATTIERFRNAVEALPDGMVILDATNRIQWANRRALSHLGIDLAKDTGRPLANFLRAPEFIRYLETENFADAVVVESQREPGATLSIQMVPFGVDERLLISRNITQVEAVSRIRRDFIANVSHELKTPLTVIAGFLETLQDVKVEAKQRTRYLQLMTEQANSMQRLVDDLLTLSTLESEHTVRADTSFAVLPLLLEVSADAKALSGKRHQIVLDFATPALVTANRDELASAFGNLVSNAVRYTPDGGTITLGWRVDDEGRGAFSVTDTGIGIAPEHIPRLTERFYRVDRSRSRATGGTGLGLAIVKHVLLRHQASLDVTSELGSGSTFTVLLPARRVIPEPLPDPAPGPISSTTSS